MSQSIGYIALVVRDYERFKARGLNFVRPLREESYGTVAVFEDLYGNKWDLLQLREIAPPTA